MSRSLQDLCLIPEVPFYLEGEGGLYEFAEKRLRENGHMVIVVAEGAGQELLTSSESNKQCDASGNPLLLDIGLWLSRKLKVMDIVRVIKLQPALFLGFLFKYANV